MARKKVHSSGPVKKSTKRKTANKLVKTKTTASKAKVAAKPAKKAQPAKTTKRKRRSSRSRIGIRDRLGQLTYRAACRLMGDEDGESRLRRGGKFEINIAEDVFLGGDTLRVRVNDTAIRDQPRATVIINEMTSMPNGLNLNCDRCAGRCAGRCDHIAATLMLVLEDKLALGLSAPPDPREPIENLTEDELLRRAIADRHQRAAEERMTLKSINPKTPWTDYTVTSRNSGKSYRVSLRGQEPGQSYCTCPDFRTNRLGTCKHILNTLGKVKRKFRQSQIDQPYQRTNFSLRVDYVSDIGLIFNVPNEIDKETASIIGDDGRRPTQNVSEVVRRIRLLEQSGNPVHIYPDAEEFIDARLQQTRLEREAALIRENPAEHPLRHELLNAELLPYQLDGIAFAVGAGRAILADDMGLGKTIQGIGVAELLARLAGIRRVLVVCPASVKSQWRSEIHRFCDRDCQIVLGSAAERVEQYQNDTFFTICNYEQILRDHKTIEATHWDLIILDEGQRIKNWESKTSRLVKSLRSQFALVLSGTPMENRLEELYTVASFVDASRLGPAYRFFSQHRVVDDRGRVEGYRKLDVLRETLKPILLRRTRGTVMQDLPPRTNEIVRIRPTEEQLNLSNEHCSKAARIACKRYLTEIDLLMIQKHLLAARMACNSTYLCDKESPGYSSKLERLEELLGQLSEEEDRKILLFSEWTTMLTLIEPLLEGVGLGFVRLDGKVPVKQRQQIIHRFQNDPECRVIIMSNAGTTGLNLQAANTVINIDLPWNPAVLEQRIGRAHRMGQQRPVQIYMLVTEDTIEERMLGTLSAKHDLALAALDVDSNVSEVELRSGMEGLKRRLEQLLGEKPATPIDASGRDEASAEAYQQIGQREVGANRSDVVPDQMTGNQPSSSVPTARPLESPSDARLSEPSTPASARQEKVAAAGGEMLGAVFNFLGELVNNAPEAHDPAPEVVKKLRDGLSECATTDASGRQQLTVTLPDRASLDKLANTLARMLVGGN